MTKFRLLPVWLACAVLTSAAPAHAAIIFSNTHNYGSVQIDVDIDDLGTLYEWIYTVHNFTFDPTPPITNGFSGFQLTVAGGIVPEVANITTPSAGWEFNCCSGAPIEFDIRYENGLGIMPGTNGVFSFTTNPRTWGPSSGWFHSWQDTEGSSFQVAINNFSSFTTGAPEVPVGDQIGGGVVPEPGTIGLLGVGLLGVARHFRNRA